MSRGNVMRRTREQRAEAEHAAVETAAMHAEIASFEKRVAKLAKDRREVQRAIAELAAADADSR